MTREEVIKWFRENPFYHKDHEPFNMAIKALEPKMGHWIEHEIEGTSRWLECSNCHYETYNVKHNYCMNCGAKMVEPQESEVEE